MWNGHVHVTVNEVVTPLNATPPTPNQRNCSGLALVNDMGRMGNTFFEFLAARVVAERWNLQLCVSQPFAQAFVSYFVGLSKRVSPQRCRQSQLRSVEFTEIHLKKYQHDMQVDCDENIAISGKRGGSITGRLMLIFYEFRDEKLKLRISTFDSTLGVNLIKIQ
jgi:hypothetical protein